MVDILLLDESLSYVPSFVENLQDEYSSTLWKNLNVVHIRGLNELTEHLSKNVYDILIAEVVNPLDDLWDSLWSRKREIMSNGMICAPYIVSQIRELQPKCRILFHTTQSWLNIHDSLAQCLDIPEWEQNVVPQYSYFRKPEPAKNIVKEIIRLTA